MQKSRTGFQIGIPSAFLLLLIFFTFSPLTPLLAHEENRHLEAISASDIQELDALTDRLQESVGSVDAQVAPERMMVSAPDSQLETAKKRAQILEAVARKDPEVFLRNVLSPSLRSQLSEEVRAVTERRVSLTGTTEVLHVDDFDNPSNSRFEYHVRVGNDRLSLYPVGAVPAFSSGSTVRIDGYQIGESVVSTGDSTGVQVLYQAVPEAVGVQQTLVVLVTSPGKPVTPTAAQMKTQIFSGAFQKFYKEQSYNKTSFAGDVTEWISLPPYSTDVCNVVYFDQPDIESYLSTNNVDLSKYGRILFVVNGATGGCATVGKSPRLFGGTSYTASLGWIGYPNTAWQKSDMTGFEYVLSHEMGHELGVSHANSWDCAGPSLDTNCQHKEYGNSYDVMGTGYLASHFNVFYKELLGWITPTAKVAINKNGTYTLSPLELSKGVRAGAIINPATPWMSPLYVEFRRPVGFDAKPALSSGGIFLNQVLGATWSAPFVQLLDANYATTSEVAPPFLTTGQTFNWNSRGINIHSLKTSSSSATFAVAFSTPVCKRGGISITNVRFSSKVGLGSSGFLQFMLTNKDSITCAPSTVAVSQTISPSTGITLTQYPTAPVSLGSGDSQFVTLQFQTSDESLGGNFTVVASIADTTNKRNYSLSRTGTIKRPPQIYSTAPTTTSAGSSVILKGSRFNIPTTTIVIQGDGVAAEMTGPFASSSARLTFVFPKTMRSDSGAGVEVPTPLGSYSIKVLNPEGTSSNSISLTIVESRQPTADLILKMAAGTLEKDYRYDFDKDGQITAADAALYLQGQNPPPNNLPTGYFDAANCKNLRGWAYDPDNTTAPLGIHIYEESTFRAGGTTTLLRGDVNTAKGITGTHGFSILTPTVLKDSKAHTLKAFAIDINGTTSVQLQLSPRTITCAP